MRDEASQGPTCTRLVKPGQSTKPGSSRRRRRRLAASALAVAIWFGGGGTGNAADLLVTTNADAGAGSLREAISTANPGDRIVFSASLTGGNTITLGSMLPIIDKNLVIDGSANSSLVIDGGGQHRAFFLR